MKSWIIGALLLIALIAIALAVYASDKVDRCLDSGGRWDATTKKCITS